MAAAPIHPGIEYAPGMPRRCRLVESLIALTVVLDAAAAPAQPRAPELQIDTLGSRPEIAGRIARVDPEHLRTIVRLVGLDDPGGPIRVVLAPEDSQVARATPAWIAGFARSSDEIIVLFPSRSARYPHDSLEAVLHHEIAHVLIHRAAQGQPVPRWFDEGLATVAERSRTFEDRRQLAWALAAGTPARMAGLDEMFQQGAGAAARAYALSGAFVREIIDRHGIEAPAEILSRLGERDTIEEAFENGTGESLVHAERAFQAQVTTWERWIPLVTSPFVLWTATTLLALYAIRIGRWRRAERRRQWAEEDEIEIEGPEVEEPAATRDENAERD
jgi:hypothetical protein